MDSFLVPFLCTQWSFPSLSFSIFLSLPGAFLRICKPLFYFLLRSLSSSSILAHRAPPPLGPTWTKSSPHCPKGEQIHPPAPTPPRPLRIQQKLKHTERPAHLGPPVGFWRSNARSVSKTKQKVPHPQPHIHPSLCFPSPLQKKCHQTKSPRRPENSARATVALLADGKTRRIVCQRVPGSSVSFFNPFADEKTPCACGLAAGSAAVYLVLQGAACPRGCARVCARVRVRTRGAFGVPFSVLCTH